MQELCPLSPCWVTCPCSVLYKHLLLTRIIEIINSTAITIYCFSHPLLDGIVTQSEHILVIIAFTSFGKVAGTSEKAMAPHSSTLAWRIPWTEEPGGPQSLGSLQVRHDWATSLSLFTFMHWRRKWQPLQCSCLENPRDGGAWWAAVYGVTQSRTRLKWLSSSSSSKYLVANIRWNRKLFLKLWKLLRIICRKEIKVNLLLNFRNSKFS